MQSFFLLPIWVQLLTIGGIVAIILGAVLVVRLVLQDQAMKWYWAILTTIVLLAMATFIDVRGGGGLAFATTALVVLSAIVVAADSSSVAWGMFVLLIWPLGLPWYLIQREDRGRLQPPTEPHEPPEDKETH